MSREGYGKELFPVSLMTSDGQVGSEKAWAFKLKAGPGCACACKAEGNLLEHHEF